jgi:tetratricopeptide (TPR) repeat protein
VIDAVSPLDAYRDDLAAAGGRARFGPNDPCWLVVATGLTRLASMRPPRSRAIARFAQTLDAYAREVTGPSYGVDARTVDRLARLVTALRDLAAGRRRRSSARVPPAEDDELTEPAPEGRAAPPHPRPSAPAAAAAAAVRGLAEDVEAAGALRLSFTILNDARAIATRAGAEESGLLLLQQARIARTLGFLDDAEALYVAAAEAGRAHGIALLTARATLARGVIARTRGNYPLARVLFEDALGEAERTGLKELAASAHEALMIATGNAGELDEALDHGRRALEAAEADRDRHAGLVTNLARLAWGAGCELAALGGYLHAARLTNAPRIRLPALSGAALAAAVLGRKAQVQRLASLVAGESSDSFPYETASAWETLWRAYVVLGAPHEAEDCRLRALELARAGGFFELVYALERDTGDDQKNKTERGSSVRIPLSAEAESVVRSLEGFASDEDTGPRAVPLRPTGAPLR